MLIQLTSLIISDIVLRQTIDSIVCVGINLIFVDVM